MPLRRGGRGTSTDEEDALEAELQRAAEILQGALRRRREERAEQKALKNWANQEEGQRDRFQWLVADIERKLEAMGDVNYDIEERLEKLEEKVAIVVEQQLSFSGREITYAQESDVQMLRRRVKALEVPVQIDGDNHFSCGPTFMSPERPSLLGTRVGSTSVCISSSRPSSTCMLAWPAEAQRGYEESSYIDQDRPTTENVEEKRRIKIMVQEVKTKRDLARSLPSPLGEDLCLAAYNGRLKDIRELIQFGADVNYTDRDGCTPLLRALCSVAPNALVVSFLIEKGADVNVVDSQGASTMHFAAGYDRTGRCVKELISAGCDVNARDEEGATPLHLAAGYDNEEAVRLLLEAGARTDAVFWSGDRKNQLPYDVAVSDSVCELLSL